MHYEINVAELSRGGNYVHLFATHERSLTTRHEARRVYEMLKRTFPAPQFSITVTRHERTSVRLDVERDLSD